MIFQNIFKFLRNQSLFMRAVFRQTDNLIFCKDETYLDHFFIPKIHVITYFVKIVRVVLEIYKSCVHTQTNILIFYKAEIYLDLLVPKIYVIPNFVKIIRAVLEIYESCIHRQLDFLQG